MGSKMEKFYTYFQRDEPSALDDMSRKLKVKLS